MLPASTGVKLSRDDHGIPHIRAKDLRGAYWGMGYCHARDRGLQILLMRILGQGRAAELLADNDETVEVDRFFRRMNWAGGAEEEAHKVDPETTALCAAYCDGVDAGLAKRVPWELRMLRYRPEAVACSRLHPALAHDGISHPGAIAGRDRATARRDGAGWNRPRSD